jgi:hypothetical protein
VFAHLRSLLFEAAKVASFLDVAKQKNERCSLQAKVAFDSLYTLSENGQDCFLRYGTLLNFAKAGKI